MRRVFFSFGILLALALASAVGAFFSWQFFTERTLVTSSLSHNTIELYALQSLRSGNTDDALEILEGELDARIVYLGGLLVLGESPLDSGPFRDFRLGHDFADKDELRECFQLSIVRHSRSPPAKPSCRITG